jgi:ABC-type transport system substrate-binding protein
MSVFLGMSCHIPPLDNPDVRKVIQSGIDKQALVEVIREPRYSRQVSDRFIPSRVPGFFVADGSAPSGRMEAQRIQEKTGALAENGSLRLVLLMEFPRTDFKHEFAKKIRDQLDVLGIRVDVDYYRSLEEVKRSETPYLIYTQRLMGMPDPEDIIRPLFSANSAANLFGYENPEIEALLRAGETEKSRSKRIKIFRQIEKILLADVPAVPLYSQQNRVAMQSWVRGVAVPHLGMYYLDAKNLWLDR